MNVDVQAMAGRLQESLGTVIVGKAEEIELCIVGLLCRGHLLIEDVPGTGKTLLAKALARSSGCSFERVQFTPDLLPGDVTGVSVYNPQQQTFEFRRADLRPGAARGRDQPSHAEDAVSAARGDGGVAGHRRRHQPPLPDPFMVLATQNPIELGGTFPLPEAQVDRFLLKLKLGYLPADDEVAMLDRFQSGSPLGELQAVTDAPRSRPRRRFAARSTATRRSRSTACRIVAADPRAPRRLARSSPRGTLGLLHAGQAVRRSPGADFVSPMTSRTSAELLEHRVVLRPNAELRGSLPRRCSRGPGNQVGADDGPALGVTPTTVCAGARRDRASAPDRMRRGPCVLCGDHRSPS